jgi:hypothetical protein
LRYVEVQAKRGGEVLALDVVLACHAGAVAEAPPTPHEKFHDVSRALRAVGNDVLPARAPSADDEAFSFAPRVLDGGGKLLPAPKLNHL